MSVEGVDWDEIDETSAAMPAGEKRDRHEARFRLGMEPFEDRPAAQLPWGVILFFSLVLAGSFLVMAYAVLKLTGKW